MAYFHRDGIIKTEDYQILKLAFNKLHFLDGIAIYYDKSASERRIFDSSQKQLENNYALVSEDGYFLQDKITMILSRFYNQVSINQYGLFKMTKIEYDISDKNKIFHHTYFYDSSGNYLNENGFEKLILILSNRKHCYNPQEFIKMIPELETKKIKINQNRTYLFSEKRNDYFENCGEEETEDGIIFYTEEFTRPGSDSYKDIHYVKDKEGNKLHVTDFYTGLTMLNNGKRYLDELCKYYIENKNGIK